MTGSGAHTAGLSKAFAKTLTTTVGITGVSLISSIITARILGPEGRGLMSAAVLIATLAATLAQAGMAGSYVYHYSAARIMPYLRILLVSLIGVSVAACVFAWGGLRISHEVKLRHETNLILLFATLMASQMYFFSLSQLHSNLNFFNNLRFGLVFGNFIILIPVHVLFKPVGFEKILISQVVVLSIVTVTASCWAYRGKIWRPNAGSKRAKITEVISYGLGQHGTTVLSLVLLNFDKLILLNRGNVIEYGYYALAFSTSRLVGAVQDAVAVALFSNFAGRDTEDLSNAVNAAFRLTFVPMLSVAAAGAILAPWVLGLVYGKAFSAVAIPFAILLFECVVSGASWTLAQRFNANGRPGLVFVRQIVSVLPVLIGAPFLPDDNAFIYLALLMLAAACIRLLMTLILYAFTLKEPLPSFMPTGADYIAAKKILLRARPWIKSARSV
ncbi:MAG: oligosaccharide flippase family protein [Paraburkholderia fungorum]|nr:oligosaccharide flippase family protein [Paraburkholderia fungorum]